MFPFDPGMPDPDLTARIIAASNLPLDGSGGEGPLPAAPVVGPSIRVDTTAGWRSGPRLLGGSGQAEGGSGQHEDDGVARVAVAEK